VRASPLPVDGRVYVGVVDGKVGAVSAVENGKLVWTRKLGSVFSSPALAGDRVLVGSDDGALHALDRAKGAVAWSVAVGGKVRATPAVADDRVVVGGFDGRVAAVALADGAVLWTRDSARAYSSPCIADGLCVFGCHEGHLHGSTRDRRAQFETARAARSSPRRGRGRRVPRGLDGRRPLPRRPDGRVRAHQTLSAARRAQLAGARRRPGLRRQRRRAARLELVR
jgi:hypothetical protein